MPWAQALTGGGGRPQRGMDLKKGRPTGTHTETGGDHRQSSEYAAHLVLDIRRTAATSVVGNRLKETLRTKAYRLGPQRKKT